MAGNGIFLLLPFILKQMLCHCTILWLVKIPEKYAGELSSLRSGHNYRAFFVLAAVLFASCSIFLLQHLLIPDRYCDAWIHNLYIRFYLITMAAAPVYALILFLANRQRSEKAVFFLCMLFCFTMISLGMTLSVLDFHNGRNLTAVFLASLGVTVMLSGPLLAYVMCSIWLLAMFSLAYLRYFHTVADPSLIVTMIFLASLNFVFGLYAEHIRLKANLSTVRMRDLTLHDQLTGAYNRLFLNEYIQKLIHSRNRYKTALSCILIDVDHFKDVNDTYGHPVGDRVLVSLVGAIREQLRNTDTITRMGGEEFLILLPETPLEPAKTVANKIRSITEHLNFNGFTLTISLGVCEIHENESFESAFSRCDTALYRAKTNGRNRVEISA